MFNEPTKFEPNPRGSFTGNYRIRQSLTVDRQPEVTLMRVTSRLGIADMVVLPAVLLLAPPTILLTWALRGRGSPPLLLVVSLGFLFGLIVSIAFVLTLPANYDIEITSNVLNCFATSFWRRRARTWLRIDMLELRLWQGHGKQNRGPVLTLKLIPPESTTLLSNTDKEILRAIGNEVRDVMGVPFEDTL